MPYRNAQKCALTTKKTRESALVTLNHRCVAAGKASTEQGRTTSVPTVTVWKGTKKIAKGNKKKSQKCSGLLESLIETRRSSKRKFSVFSRICLLSIRGKKKSCQRKGTEKIAMMFKKSPERKKKSPRRSQSRLKIAASP